MPQVNQRHKIAILEKAVIRKLDGVDMLGAHLQLFVGLPRTATKMIISKAMCRFPVKQALRSFYSLTLVPTVSRKATMVLKTRYFI